MTETTLTDLTPRECEVLEGIARGMTNAQIGAELYLTEDSVKGYAVSLFRKLGASNRPHAVAIGFRTGRLT